MLRDAREIIDTAILDWAAYVVRIIRVMRIWRERERMRLSARVQTYAETHNIVAIFLHVVPSWKNKRRLRKRGRKREGKRERERESERERERNQSRVVYLWYAFYVQRKVGERRRAWWENNRSRVGVSRHAHRSRSKAGGIAVVSCAQVSALQ
jgi:hypothetical protein